MEAHENYPVGRKNMVQDKWLYLSGIEQMDDYAMGTLHSGYLKRLEYLDGEVGNTIWILKKRVCLTMRQYDSLGSWSVIRGARHALPLDASI